MPNLLLRGAQRIWNRMARKCLFPIGAACVILFSMASTHAVAEVKLIRSQDGIILEANNATLSEIVSAVKSGLKMNINIVGPVTQTYTGVYSGSIHRVLSRLLSGRNYIIKNDLAGINIVLLGENRYSPDSNSTAQAAGAEHEIAKSNSAAELNPMGSVSTNTSLKQPSPSATASSGGLDPGAFSGSLP
jgi:hypothetical protein